jgi:hypothetical protein
MTKSRYPYKVMTLKERLGDKAISLHLDLCYLIATRFLPAVTLSVPFTPLLACHVHDAQALSHSISTGSASIWRVPTSLRLRLLSFAMQINSEILTRSVALMNGRIGLPVTLIRNLEETEGVERGFRRWGCIGCLCRRGDDEVDHSDVTIP